MNIKITLEPKQIELKNLIEDSLYTWIGYGGARGGAKSFAIRELALYFGLKYGIKVFLFRRNRSELLDNHIYPLLQNHPDLKKYFNKQEMTLFNPAEPKQPLIKFGYADNDTDVYTYQGSEYPLMFIDEATQSTQEMIEFLKTSNRDPEGKFPGPAKMVLTMNPGGVGHAFIRRIFIDRSYTGNENPDNYVFIQASVWDNVYWVMRQLKKDKISVKQYYKWPEKKKIEYTLKYSDYAQNLATLPEELKRAYLFGDWDIFGGMFFKGFDSKAEIIEPFRIPKEWRLIGALDPGFSSPCAFSLLAQDFDGNVYVIATYYESEKNAIEHARSIKAQFFFDSPVWALIGRYPSMIVAGLDAWARKDRWAVMGNDKTWAEWWAQEGLYLTRATTDRKAGWWAWKALLPNKFFIFKGFNKALVSEMTALVTDKKDVEDIQGKGNNPNVADHAVDEVRYGIMALTKPYKEEKEVTPIMDRFLVPMEERVDERVWW